jgi:hypothetical protein
MIKQSLAVLVVSLVFGVGCTDDRDGDRSSKDGKFDRAVSCTHDGKTFELGATRPDQCNTCVCDDLGGGTPSWVCTKKACFGCTHGDEFFGVGESRPDQCNTCTCDDLGGGSPSWVCTKKACFGCTHNDQFFNIGESRPEQCNTCTCDDLGAGNPDWVCTTKACFGCTHEGAFFEEGATRPDDECPGNTCTCTAGENGLGWACTELPCSM